MKLNTILVMVSIILIVLFMFRYSGYEEGSCKSDNPEFVDGMRCYDENDIVNLSGPFCREECKGTWK